MATINPELKLYPAYFKEDEFSKVEHLSKALLTQSEWLSPMVTHAFGSSKQFGRQNFPLSFLTEGMGNVKSIQTTDLTYKVPIMGKPKKTSAIAAVPFLTGDKPGIGFGTFTMTMADRHLHKSQSAYTASKLELRVVDDPTPAKGSTGWDYTFQLVTNSPNKYVPLKDLTVGTLLAGGIAKVGKAFSRGVESRSYSPYSATNQITVVRDTYKLAGNVKNKVMILEIKADGKTFKYWTQWELYLKHLMWKEKCESDLWYSTYNRDKDGRIHNEDRDSGEVVPSGAGLLQQIPNIDHYSRLTTKKLDNLITDIFFNASDADQIVVDIYTGTGGMREANAAMKDSAMDFTFIRSEDFIKASNSVNNRPNTLTYGAYFDTYMHPDGHTVRFIKLPLMDRGIIADISPRHPLTGLPMESYNMYAIDNSVYDGMQNLQYINELGREQTEFVVAGASVPPGYEETIFRASDIDACSIEMIKTQGIYAMRPTNMFKLLNNFS